MFLIKLRLYLTAIGFLILLLLSSGGDSSVISERNLDAILRVKSCHWLLAIDVKIDDSIKTSKIINTKNSSFYNDD